MVLNRPSVLPLSSLALTLTVLAACGGDPEASRQPERPTSSPTASPTPSEEESPSCPNPDGGRCLGLVEAGTYQTEDFEPGLTYSLPDGWANMEDLPGNFLLLPPGRDLAGVDAARSDFVGASAGTTVSAPDCSPLPMPGVGLQPSSIVEALRKRPGIDVSHPREVTIGGLSGLAVDIRMIPGTEAACEVEGGYFIVPLIIGVGPASLEHSVSDGLLTRLYVLENGDSNVVIEVSDIDADRSEFEFEPIVKNFRFG